MLIEVEQGASAPGLVVVEPYRAVAHLAVVVQDPRKAAVARLRQVRPLAGHHHIAEFLRSTEPGGVAGNVRELQKTMLHTASLPAEVLDIDDFVPMLDAEAISDGNAPGAEDLLDLLLRLDEMPSFAEMKQIMTNAALIRGGGRQTAAAKILGISQPALSKRLKAERGED